MPSRSKGKVAAALRKLFRSPEKRDNDGAGPSGSPARRGLLRRHRDTRKLPFILQHFYKDIKNEPGSDSITAVCNKCSKTLKGSFTATSNFLNHIKRKGHGDVLVEYERLKPKSSKRKCVDDAYDAYDGPSTSKQMRPSAPAAIFLKDGVGPAEAAASLPSSPATATTLSKKKTASAAEARERAAAVRTRRLMKELKEIQRVQDKENPVFTVELVNDNLYEWHVRLHQIDPESELAGDLRELGIPSILLHLVFPDNFPFAPPFMRVIEPRIEKGFVMEGGAICMELLTPRGWASAYTIEAVVMQFAASVVKGHGRVARAPPRVTREFSQQRAEEAFRMLVRTHDKYGWVTPSLSDG